MNNQSFRNLALQFAPKYASSEQTTLVANIHRWARETFGEQGSSGKLAHLALELDEVRLSHKLEEYADCMMLLLDAAKHDGYNVHEVFGAVEVKLHINKGREWGEPNPDGVVEHIREGD